MPPEIVDLLAGLSVARAICLSLMVCGSAAALLLLALSEGPLVPDCLRRTAAYEWLALLVFQARDRAHLAVKGARIALAHRLTPTATSQKGATR